jgi:uncharacterized protein YfkK (UPF0435 family)
MSDVHIISGLDTIVNPDNIKPGINLKELEQQMISGGFLHDKVKDPSNQFNEEIKECAQKLGISFGIDDITRPAQVNNYSNNITQDKYPSQEDETDHESESEEVEPVSNSRNLQQRTHEQTRREHIEHIIGPESAGDFSLENEKREDMKSAMLAEIDELISILNEVNVDLTRIPQVTQDTSYEDIEKVLRMLRHKNDYSRYCDLAQEGLLTIAHGLEELFDGKRMWFNRYQPDLTDWHNSVGTKFRRIRHDMGQVVSGVMQEYNISPFMQILLELVPNLFIYSKLRKHSHSQRGLYTEAEMNETRNRINNI